MFDEVAKGAQRIAERVVVAGTIGLSVLSPTNVLAQNAPTPNGGGQPVSIGNNAGEVAADICRRRGDTTVDCIANERNRLVRQIEQQANSEADCAQRVEALARDPAVRARGDALLKGRSPSQYGFCRFMRDLAQ